MPADLLGLLESKLRWRRKLMLSHVCFSYPYWKTSFGHRLSTLDGVWDGHILTGTVRVVFYERRHYTGCGGQGKYHRVDPLPNPGGRDPVAPLKYTTGVQDNFLLPFSLLETGMSPETSQYAYCGCGVDCYNTLAAAYGLDHVHRVTILFFKLILVSK